MLEWIVVLAALPAARTGLALELDVDTTSLECVDAAALERAVAATSDDPILAPATTAAALLHVQVASSSVVRTRFHDYATGRWHDETRTLPPGACAEKLEALAHIVWGLSGDYLATEPARAPLRPVTETAPVVEPLAPQLLEVSAAARLDVGPLPAPAGGAEITLALRWPRIVELNARAGVALARGHPVTSRASADFLLADLTLAACSPELVLRLVELRGCAGLRAGISMAQGSDFTVPLEKIGPRAEPELGVSARVTLGRRLGAFARAALLVPIIRREYRYVVDGVPETFHRPPPVTLALTLGLSLDLAVWAEPIRNRGG